MTRPSDEELIERRTKMILEERRAGVQKWFYLSYADDSRGGFRGGIYTYAYGFVEATTRAARLGISPGGQVMGVECPIEHLPAPEYRERLLTKEEVQAACGGDAHTIAEFEQMEKEEGNTDA